MIALFAVNANYNGMLALKGMATQVSGLQQAQQPKRYGMRPLVQIGIGIT